MYRDIVTMTVAAAMHLGMPPEAPGAGIKGAAHAIEVGIVFLGLLFTGPGRFAVSCPICQLIEDKFFATSCSSEGAKSGED